MSCIRFSTPAQLRQLRDGSGSPVMLTAQQAATAHPMPVVTASKIHRLRVLAADPNPKIRESVASSLHAPRDLYLSLATDPDAGVRCCIARNAAVPVDVLRAMLVDDSEQVRGWLALNRSAPLDVLERIESDESATVRRLLDWRRSHRG